MPVPENVLPEITGTSQPAPAGVGLGYPGWPLGYVFGLYPIWPLNLVALLPVCSRQWR